MYMAVLQSEECMERVACEVGGLAADAGISKSLTRASEAFLPKKYNKMMRNFNHGKDCSKNNMIERVQDMYMAVLQSEECMERVACEVGGLAADAGISKSLTRASEAFLPKKYNKMMKNFNHGKDCSKNNKCGVF